jgi:uncharacterized damage-inducible protein DinB
MNRPKPDEYGSFYAKYIDLVSDDVITELVQQAHSVPEFLRNIPKEKQDYAYGEGKWSIKELLGHLIDTERIMVYRLLRFARKDLQPLLGFEENDYVRNSHYSEREFDELVEELAQLRRSNVYFFKSISEEDLLLTGEASGCPVSVRALLFIIAGHIKHHETIIEERYLNI